MKQREGKAKISAILLFCGLFPVFLMGSIEVLASLGFFFGFPVSGAYVPVSIVVSLFLLFLFGRNFGRLPEMAAALFGIVLMLTVSYGLAVHFLDVTWDGQGYHQSAILKLANGWDPVTTYVKTGENRLLKYANYYSKGPWVCAASVFRLTGNIETGKMFNLLLMMSAFLLSLVLLLRLRGFGRYSVLFALLAALNPVSVCQMFSFLVDGQLAALIVIAISLGLLFFIEENYLIDAGFSAAIVLGFNVKFNGVAYIGLVVFFLFLGAWFFYRSRFTWKRIRITVYAGLIAVFLVGFNPYVTNTACYGNPFYPILGPHKIDVLRLQRPVNFINKNRFSKLYLSLFSRSENSQGLLFQFTHSKNPFTFTETEFRWFVQSSLRIGGFGPLFGGILILSLLSFFGMMLLYRKERPELMLFLAGLILSVIINPDGWWARLAPQLWLFPLILAGYLFSLKKKIAKGFGFAVVLLLLGNIAGITWSYTTQYAAVNRKLKQQLHSLENVPIIMSPGLLKSIRNRLHDYHIPFREVSSQKRLPCLHPERLVWSTARFCRLKGYTGHSRKP